MPAVFFVKGLTFYRIPPVKVRLLPGVSRVRGLALLFLLQDSLAGINRYYLLGGVARVVYVFVGWLSR